MEDDYSSFGGEPVALERVPTVEALLKYYASGEREFRKIYLVKAALARAQLMSVNFRDARLNDIDLSGACLKESDLRGARLERANLDGADLTKVNFTNGNLAGARARGTNLLRARLDHVNLCGVDLFKANLHRAKLNHANMIGTNLREATLSSAEIIEALLSGTQFVGANLAGAVLTRSNLETANLSGANLDGATLVGANLIRACCEGAILTSAELSDADLSGADLTGANLKGARLGGANLTGANLTRADLRGARLHNASLGRTNLTGANLDHADLAGARFDGAELADVTITGATRIAHTVLTDVDVACFCRISPKSEGPSTTDFRTILKSVHAPGLKPFLRLTGVPDIFVEYMVDCARSLEPKEAFSLLRSTFISYGQPDHEFARKLNEALKARGVTTFFFEDNALPGTRLNRMMREGVNSHDRVILICSAASLERKGLQNELVETLDRESRDGGAEYLIPVRLDDCVLRDWEPERADLAQTIRARVVADFKDHEDPERFDAELTKLFAVLKKPVVHT